MKDNEIENPLTELENLYELNKNHIADLVFFDDEVKFLRGLMNKYFIKELNDENINKCQMIERRLFLLILVKINVVKDSLLHQGNLQTRFKEINIHSNHFFILESERILKEMEDLSRNFKNIKKEIFQLSKEIIGFGKKFSPIEQIQ